MGSRSIETVVSTTGGRRKGNERENILSMQRVLNSRMRTIDSMLTIFFRLRQT